MLFIMHIKISFVLFFLLFFSGCMNSKNENKTSAQKTLTINLTGDVMIGRLVDTAMSIKGLDYPWGTMKQFLTSDDITLINLETTFTTSDNPTPKVFNFKANPDHAVMLVHGNITAVSLANNHILDFGLQGLKDTLQTLNELSITHTGTGLNLIDAQKPIIIERKGIKIGIISATDNKPKWAATIDHYGTNFFTFSSYDHIIQQIQKLKPSVDYVILSLHWDTNWPRYIPTDMISCAHDFIDAGVDIIHGHSSHKPLGVEVYKNKIILYGTGDFIDDYAIDPVERNDLTFLFQITLSKNQLIKLSLIPAQIRDMSVHHVTDSIIKEFLFTRMQKESAVLGTTLIQEDNILTHTLSDS